MISKLFHWRLSRFFALVFGLVLIVSLLRSIITFWQRGTVVIDEEKRMQVLERKNQELKKQYEETKQAEFLERMAREKLTMSKEGEVVVIMPSITVMPMPTPTIELEPWQEWASLLRIGER